MGAALVRRGLGGSLSGRRRCCLRCTLALWLLGGRHIERPLQTARGQSEGQKSGKQTHLKPLKAAPAALVVSDAETWSAAELKAMRGNLSKELERLRADLAKVESEMDSLIKDGGEGAGDDQADAGNKTFEREHEMSLLINARDMVIQTERAIDRIDNKSYGVCEVCGNQIGKARLEVFPRATLCMSCKQKEERR